MTTLSPTAATRHPTDVVVLSTGDVRIPRFTGGPMPGPRLTDQRYRQPAGDADLRRLIAARSGPVDAGQVVVTPGARQAIVAALKAVLGADRREVLIPAPYWTSYPPLVDLAGGTGVVVPGPTGAGPDPAVLEAARTPRTAAVIVNSPRNPDGATVSAPRLRALVDWAAGHRIVVLFDQVYRGVALTPQPAASVLDLAGGLPPHCIVVDGLSKSHALAGLRVGWTLADPDTTARIVAVASHLVGHTSGPAQDVATAVLRDGAGDRRADPDLTTNLSLAIELLDDVPGLTCHRPGGGIFLFPDVRGWLATVPIGAADLVPWLAREHRVAVVDGAAFGAPGHLRLSFAVPTDQLRAGVERLRAAFTAARTPAPVREG
jgi:aspartate aminotransferase